MDALAAIVAVPSALLAAKVVSQTATALTRPFSAVLNSAAHESPAAGEAAASSIVERLESALARAGVSFGDSIELQIDAEDGSVRVGGDQPQSSLVEAALAAEPGLFAELARIADNLEKPLRIDLPTLSAAVVLSAH